MSKSRHWVITGASRGIGLELVAQVLESGDRVTSIARNLDSQTSLRNLQGRYAERLTALDADVARDEDVARAARELGDEVVDVLVNNAGILREADLALEQLNLALVEEQFQVNALAPMRVTRAFLPHLRRSDRPIVANISSKMGSIADASSGSYGYRMSKTGLNMFTKCLAAELDGGIALALHPGWVQTSMGGSNAPVEVKDSAAGLLNVIRSATLEQTGQFFGFRGERIPW